jgi:hypothetical protein
MKKNMFPKGANRFCTEMYLVCRSLKFSGTPAANARHLVIIGDNYSENKNNINLAWASEMIMMGWYDKVDFLYGPVGHTHNGIDMCHKTHNNSLSKFACGTLGQWVANFPQVCFIYLA